MTELRLSSGFCLRLCATLFLLGFISAFATPPVPTTITANGLGTTILPPASGVYNITGGTPMGNNLYHSFSTFNLGTGDTANFNVGSNVANILARVTGGPSTIDGNITSTINGGAQLSNANLFFINPAGVLFTANAVVNLGGSLIVSTADVVKFDDGHGNTGKFYSQLGQGDILSSSPVSAFGFLSATPKPVEFDGSQIFMNTPGSGLHVLAGNITLDQGSPDGVNEQGTTIVAPGNNVSLFSSASMGEVPFTLANPGTGYATAPFAAFGNITMQNQSTIAIDGTGGGSVVIRGGKITVDNSEVSSVSGASATATNGSISVQADQLTVSNGSIITADSVGPADAGSVAINVAQKLEVTGAGSEISADTFTAGNGGTLSVMAGSVDLHDGDLIASTNNAAGTGGTLTVTASSMTMEGIARVSSLSDGDGDAGTIKLTLSGPLTMTDAAGVIADGVGSGNAGDINIMANSVNMTGQSEISASIFGATGGLGKISVTANTISMQGSATGAPGIFVNSQGTGFAGTIDINSGFFSMSGGASVSATTGNSNGGEGGDVLVAVGTLSLAGGSVITAASLGAGDGGNVMIDCGQGELDGGSQITSSSSFSNAGSIEITAADSFTLASGSSVSTSAGLSGGNITLRVNRLIELTDSSIVAFAGVQNPAFGFTLTPMQELGLTGGNILIDPQFVVLNNSLISANDLSPLGADGNITNFANFFFTSGSILHASGTIITTAPDLDLASSLAPLSANLVDVQNQLRETCARSVNHETSSLIVVGRGGTETSPEEYQSDFGLAFRQPSPSIRNELTPIEFNSRIQ